jgi:hypothetical protein
MPLMQPEKKVTNDQLNVTLSSETLQELRAYAGFLNNSSVAYVLTQLVGTLGRDKEFQQWKAAHPPEVQATASTAHKNGGAQKE